MRIACTTRLASVAAVYRHVSVCRVAEELSAEFSHLTTPHVSALLALKATPCCPVCLLCASTMRTVPITRLATVSIECADQSVRKTLALRLPSAQPITISLLVPVLQAQREILTLIAKVL